MPACKWGCDQHIKQSKGGDSDLMKFYCTTSATTYGQHWNKFQPRKGIHKGTGYLANFRPQVYYNSHLDDLDNPALKPLLADNYLTVTKRDYQGYSRPYGNGDFGTIIKQGETGFIREKPLNIPTAYNATSLFLDKNVLSAPPVGVRQRQVPILHQGYPKDPTEAENYGYGPEYMSTETQSKYRNNPMTNYPGRDIQKQETGFTHAINDEPITYYAEKPYDGRIPDFMTNRPTGISVATTSFIPFEYGAEKNKLPRLTEKAARETGFTNMGERMVRSKSGPPGTAVTGDTYVPKPLQPGYDNNQVGNKEETGFTDNQSRFIQTDDNPLRFVTHYQTRFLDRTAPDRENQGHVWGSVLPQKSDGYTKSTAVHSLAEVDDYGAALPHMHPYVSRSILARDKFYDDHKYDSKKHVTFSRVVTAS